MPKEQFPSMPNLPTTPERVIEEKGVDSTKEKQKLSPEQLETRVQELMDLSAARVEASKHVRESWGGLTKTEREELKAQGDDAVAAQFDALKIDPEMAEFSENVLAEYDARIQELGSNSKVMETYKERFEGMKDTLANVLTYEHLQKELSAVTNSEQKLRVLYEKIGRAPGPIERTKLTDLTNRREELQNNVTAFELDPASIDMLRRREVRRTQQDLERYSFAETESRTKLIQDVLPDLLRGAPILFQGETGSGKTQLAKYISHRFLGYEVAPISISEQIKESQIMGRVTLKDGATDFLYSELVKSMKEGRPVILDEMNLMPHEFQGILNEIFQLRVGSSWKHPSTGESIKVAPGFVIFATANLKSERYKQRYELDVATLRRFIGGAGAKEIHYLDLGKKNKEGEYIAPETLTILAGVLADRNGAIAWDEQEAPQKLDALKRFVGACRKIQEDFTLSMREGGEDSLARSDKLAFKELVITLKDQIEIMKAWKASGFAEPLENVVLREFFRKAEISGRAAKDRENMIKVFMANKFFKDTNPEEFDIQGLSSKTVRQWQGKE
ncbi:MAG: AAA family ATPase [Patescibacteria group bacterium]|nr:AAA family ATPase [Patescibacteria group bacterium]MDE2438134.1 AAA family ATPase [Patescibacteria group bacterium]